MCTANTSFIFFFDSYFWHNFRLKEPNCTRNGKISYWSINEWFFLTNAFGQNLLRDLSYFTSLVLMILILNLFPVRQFAMFKMYNLQCTIYNLQCTKCTSYNFLQIYLAHWLRSGSKNVHWVNSYHKRKKVSQVVVDAT